MISTADLANQKFDGITLPEPYGSLLGKIPMNTTGVIWGPKGSGKSTMAVSFAYVLANELGKGIYCSSEEGPGPSMQNKIKRLEAEHEELMVTDFDGLGDLKAAIQYSGSKFCILDSASMGYVKLSEFEEFHDWCKKQGVILFYILHANKEGRYKGNTMFVHMPDIEIKVSEGIAETEKNRFAETPRSMEVQFNTSDTRENPVETPFSISLKDFYNIHKIRSWKRLNSMLGAQTPCYTPKHSGESEHSEFSIRYIPDYHNKKYPVELLIDNKVEYQACTEGESGDFQSSLEKLIEDHGDIEVIVHDQDHAKLVLGAKEYKRQEKERAKKKEKPKKSAKSEKQSKESVPDTIKHAEAHTQDDIPTRPNVAFRMLYDFPSGKNPMGITWAKHDGTVESIQMAAKKAQDYAYDLFGNDYTNAGSPIFATDETGEVTHAISPNFSTVAEVTTKRAFDMYGLALEKVGVDVSKFVEEANKGGKPELPSKTEKKSKSQSQSKKKKPKAQSKSKSKQSIDVDEVKKSQDKLDNFLDEILKDN